MAGKPGKSGRKPKSKVAKMLAGTLRSDRFPLEPGAGLPLLAAVPYCPVHIKGPARKEWLRVARLLILTGVLTRAHTPALELYCTLYGRWKEAEAQIVKDGLVSMGGLHGTVPVPSPYVRISDDAMRQVRLWLGEFGLTPSSGPKATKPGSEKPQSKEEELNAYFFDRRN
jgi:P27 family predicted phage terminase small subunit